jgi:hypothetical protein
VLAATQVNMSVSPTMSIELVGQPVNVGASGGSERMENTGEVLVHNELVLFMSIHQTIFYYYHYLFTATCHIMEIDIHINLRLL